MFTLEAMIDSRLRATETSLTTLDVAHSIKVTPFSLPSRPLSQSSQSVSQSDLPLTPGRTTSSKFGSSRVVPEQSINVTELAVSYSTGVKTQRFFILVLWFALRKGISWLPVSLDSYFAGIEEPWPIRLTSYNCRN